MKTGFGLALAVALLTGGTASAGMIVTVEETGGDVVATGVGTLDASAWAVAYIATPFDARISAEHLLAVGTAGNVDIYLTPVGFAGPSTIGPGLFPGYAGDSGTGDLFALQFSPSDLGLGVPTGYVSGDPLAGTATWENHTFASIGLVEGSYTWTWDTARSSGDFFTINIVPEPATLSLLALGGLAMIRRRR